MWSTFYSNLCFQILFCDYSIIPLIKILTMTMIVGCFSPGIGGTLLRAASHRPMYLWKRLILRFWYGALCHFLPEITCSSTFFFFSSISIGSKCLFDLQLCRPLYFSFFGGPFFFYPPYKKETDSPIRFMG